MKFRKAIGKLHLLLGLSSGLVVCFLGITGCILAFQSEIESLTRPWQYVETVTADRLPPSAFYNIAVSSLPGKIPHSVTYGLSHKAAVITYFQDSPSYYYRVYAHPATGKVLKVQNMNDDFFRIVVNGHFYLWLPPAIGKPIVASATLIFVVLLVSGFVLWWPRNKAAGRQRFSIKWRVGIKRLNYDLHSVLGFYVSWVAIFIAITGLVWGFQWVSSSVYWLTSGGKTARPYHDVVSQRHNCAHLSRWQVIDSVWRMTCIQYGSTAKTIEVHYPPNDSASIAIAANPEKSTYWKTDYRYFDQYCAKEIEVDHQFGRLANAALADRIARMNYDIHVGAIFGLPGKLIAFFASLLTASLPVTGFLIWRGRRRKRSQLRQ